MDLRDGDAVLDYPGRFMVISGVPKTGTFPVLIRGEIGDEKKSQRQAVCELQRWRKGWNMEGTSDGLLYFRAPQQRPLLPS